MEQKTILDDIVAWKRLELAAAAPDPGLEKAARDAPAPRDMAAALRRGGVALIAEVKRASPSKGLLNPHLDAAALARTYAAGGAAVISVLTDGHFFQGSLADLRAVRGAVDLPVLRKDFILDPCQVYEARAAGADAVLLIAAVLDDERLHALYRLVRDLGMDALVEVHDEAELDRALSLAPRIVGVNNRDLRTFQVDLETTARLQSHLRSASQYPPGVTLVAESGIHTPADVARLAAMGAHAMLVGEALVCAADTEAAVRRLVRAGAPVPEGRPA